MVYWATYIDSTSVLYCIIPPRLHWNVAYVEILYVCTVPVEPRREFDSSVLNF